MSQSGFIVFSKPRPTPPSSLQNLDIYEVGEDGTILKPILLTRVEGTIGRLTATVSIAPFETSLQNPQIDSQRARAGFDFDPNPLTVVFDDGEISKTISIPIRQDRLVEGDEYFVIRVDDGQAIVTNPEIDPRSAIVKIVDDDTLRPKVPRADFNDDKRGDILWLSNTGEVAVWQINSTQIQSSDIVRNVGNSGWAVQSIADFNGDAKADILWYNSNTGEVATWLMDGTKIAQAQIVLQFDNTQWRASGTGDFNGDGKTDIIWLNPQLGQARIWQMNGNMPQTEGVVPEIDGAWQVQGVGDFNADQKDDLLWLNQKTGEVGIWQMNGVNPEQSSILLSLPDAANWKMQGLGDFNADGKADALWYNTRTTEVAVWQMNGTAIDKSAVVFTVGDQNWKIRGVADFNGDGADDLLWFNQRSGEVGIWQMNGLGIETTTIVLKLADRNWDIRGVSEYNGDAIADILWMNLSSGEVAVWQMAKDLTIDKGTILGSVGRNPAWQVQGASGFRYPLTTPGSAGLTTELAVASSSPLMLSQ